MSYFAFRLRVMSSDSMRQVYTSFQSSSQPNRNTSLPHRRTGSILLADAFVCCYEGQLIVFVGMQSLKRQRSELDAESKRLRLQLRAATWKAKASTRVDIREPARSIARALVTAHAGEPTAAAEYVRRSRRCPHPESHMAAVAEELRVWWTSADATTRERHRVISDDNAGLHKAIRSATKFLVDAELENWVEEQNVQKGISPTPGVMIGRANEIKTKHGVLTPRSRKGCRRWVARWRRRRTVRLRLLPTQQRIPDEEMHSKAIVSSAPPRNPSLDPTGFDSLDLHPGKKRFRFPVIDLRTVYKDC